MRGRPFLIKLASMLLLGIVLGTGARVANGQNVAEVPTASERALAARYPNEWAKLTPEQRERLLVNYQQWQQMTPQERYAAQRSYQQFRALSPEERHRVLAALQQWRKLPDAQRRQLRQAYARYKALPL